MMSHDDGDDDGGDGDDSNDCEDGHADDDYDNDDNDDNDDDNDGTDNYYVTDLTELDFEQVIVSAPLSMQELAPSASLDK